MLFNRAWLVIVMLLSIVALPIRVSATSPTVIFSEIAWAGSSISSSDEWIELVNLTADTIDLSLWTITGAGSSGKILTLPAESSIAPYSTFLIANYENGNASTALATIANYVTATVSLPNDGFGLALFDALGSQVDVAGGNGSPFAGGSGSVADSADGRYRSMVRADGLIAGSDEAAWGNATASSGFLDGVTDLGTPGMAEQVVEVVNAVEVVTVVEEEEAVETIEEIVAEEISPIIEEAIEEDLSVPSDSSDLSEAEVVADTEVVEKNISVQTEPVVPTEPVVASVPVVTQTVTTIFYSPGVILVNEFVVDPVDNATEWIELTNRSTQTIVLTGWTIEDATGKTTDLSTITIMSGSYIVIDSPKGKLNNDGDTIILRDATGAVIDSVSYGTNTLKTPQDSMALARNSSNIFELTKTTTPGGPNVIFVEKVVEVVKVTEVIKVVKAVEVVQAEKVETVRTTTYTGPTTLQFLKLYPNTTGDDALEEYIELTNTGDKQVDLFGWIIEDGSTDRHTFSQSQIIEAGATVIIPRADSAIALNNTGDTLELLDPNNDVVDTVTYGNASKGSLYTLVNGVWTWSAMVSTAEATIDATTTTARTVASTKLVSTVLNANNVTSLTIEQSKNLADGTRVRVEGVVIALPGSLGRQFFYLMDATGGIQIYFYDAEFPELALGQNVRVLGDMSSSHGERRVKMGSLTDLTYANSETAVSATSLSIMELQENLIGSLVMTSGIVQSRQNGKLILEDGGSELVVYLKSTPEIDANRFERGDRVTVTGILTSYDGELRIRPRMDEDIVVDESAATLLALSTDESGKGIFDSSQSRVGLILLMATAAALGLLAFRRNQMRHQPKLSTP